MALLEHKQSNFFLPPGLLQQGEADHLLPDLLAIQQQVFENPFACYRQDFTMNPSPCFEGYQQMEEFGLYCT